MEETAPTVIEREELRDRTRVFADRAEAGGMLAEMLAGEYRGSDALVLGVPAGGVPVAIEIARELSLDLDVAVASKLTPPGNTEAGYGAVAWDGTFRLNRPLLRAMGLGEEQMQIDLATTNKKVKRRLEHLRRRRDRPSMAGRPVLLVDDGLATGMTMAVAAEAAGNEGAQDVVVAVPTAHPDAIRRLAPDVRAVYVANLRSGVPFAVADAYHRWSDISEDQASRLLKRFRKSRGR